MKTKTKTICFMLFLAIALLIMQIKVVSAVTPYYTKDPSTCPQTDPIVFPGQNCNPIYICGNVLGIAQCYNTPTITMPSVYNPSYQGQVASGLAAGYVLDCYNPLTCVDSFWCSTNSSCNTWHRTTVCNSTTVTNCNGCMTDYYDCDLDPDDCEVHQGDSCTLGGLPGTYDGCDCIVSRQHFITGLNAQYSSNLSAGESLLWGTEWGEAMLMNLTSMNSSSHIYINNSACIIFNDNSFLCNASAGGGSGTDELIKISALDQFADYLENKLIAGNGIYLTTVTNLSGYQTLNVDVDESELNFTKNHSALINLDADDHLQYFKLTGRGLGQIAYGGLAYLILRANSDADYSPSIQMSALELNPGLVLYGGTSPYGSLSPDVGKDILILGGNATATDSNSGNVIIKSGDNVSGTGTAGDISLLSYNAINLNATGGNVFFDSNISDRVTSCSVTDACSGGTGTNNHSLLTNLDSDDHLQYALLHGRGNNQTLNGASSMGVGKYLALYSAENSLVPSYIILNDGNQTISGDLLLGTGMAEDNTGNVNITTADTIHGTGIPGNINLFSSGNINLITGNNNYSVIIPYNISNGTYGCSVTQACQTGVAPVEVDPVFTNERDNGVTSNWFPRDDNVMDLGNAGANLRWANLYLAGNLDDNAGNRCTVQEACRTDFLTAETDPKWSANASGTALMQNITLSGTAIHLTGQSRIRYNRSANQNITLNGAFTTVVSWNNLVYDQQSEWNGTRFTPKNSGYYRVHVAIIFDTYTWADSNYAMLSLFKKNVLYSRIGRYECEVTGASYVDLMGTDTVYLNVTNGDYLEFKIQGARTPAWANIYADSTYNYISIEKFA